MVENAKSEINAEVKRLETELYNPKYIQLLKNPELEDELIAVSLVAKRAFKLTEEKTQQCRKESKSNDFTLIDCEKEVAIISFWIADRYSRIMCYRQL